MILLSVRKSLNKTIPIGLETMTGLVGWGNIVDKFVVEGRANNVTGLDETGRVFFMFIGTRNF